MKSKEKMVLSTEKKSKSSTDIPKQSRKLNSSSTIKKCVKKEIKEKILQSLSDKSEEFNDSSDFVSPLNKWKPLKNEKSLNKPSIADSKESKKQTKPRSFSTSSVESAPLSTVATPVRRRTRSSERKIQEEETEEEERHIESITNNSEPSKSSPVLPSISKAALKGYSASKPGKYSSQELKKQTSSAPKFSKVKVEPQEKDERLRRAPAKKLAKSEPVESNVKSSSFTGKGGQVPGKGNPPIKRRTYRPRSKSSENSDTSNISEKSSQKMDTPIRKQTRKENLNSSKTPEKSSGKRAQSSPRQDRTPTKNKDHERNTCEFIDSSPILAVAEKRSPPKIQSSIGCKEISNDNSPVNSSQPCTVKCPTCKELIPEEGLGRHILMCLKNKYEAGTKSHISTLSDREQLCKDEILARQIHEDMNRDILSSKESAPAEDLTLCHICQKDLTHMNNIWKTRHINQCIDKSDEENAHKKKKLAASLRQQVLACPMCGKQFKTGALRRCHLKKCAQELSVSPEKALKLIAEQEKNFKESQLALAPAAAIATSSTSARSLHKKLNKVPDEQMQMAMALSSSLFDEQKKLNDQLTETVKNIHQGVNRELKKLKKSQKKAPSESVPLLLTVSKEDQLARNAQRVDSIISEVAQAVHFPRQFPNSSLSLSSGDVYQMTENPDSSKSTPSFWSRASLTDPSMAPKLFYVQSLMPPIQVDTVTVGSRLKPMSAIPGRGLDMEETDSVSDNLGDAPAQPLTQTAVLLAELAQSNEEDFDDEESSGSVIEQTQGFYLPQETDDNPSTDGNEALITLGKDICQLLNQSQLSDVEFITADTTVVFAHRLILSVRCPLILNVAETRGNCLVIKMKDVSHNSLLAFLRYIYGGQVDFEKSVTADLLQLARKFKVSQLALICENMLRSFIDDVCYTSSVESIAGDVPKPLEIDDDNLTENDDDGMASDSHSVELYKDDILSGVGEPSSEKLCSSPGASPLKNSHGSVLNFSPGHNDLEIQTVVPAEISKTITEHSDMEVSPEKQNKRKVPFSVCDDDSISVIEPLATLVDKTALSSAKDPNCLDAAYKKSDSIHLELDEGIADKSCRSDIISEPNKLSFIQSVAVFQDKLKEKETAVLVSNGNTPDEMSTSFRGPLSGEDLDTRSTEPVNASPNVSQSVQDPGFTNIPSATSSPQDQNWSNNALSPMQCQEEENKLCTEKNSLNQTLTLCALSDYDFDDSNELFSESEDFRGGEAGGGESENVAVSMVNSPKLEAKTDPMHDSLEISNDSICFLSESRQNVQGSGLTFTALHLADTVCENSADEDSVSRNLTIKATSPPETRRQSLNSNCNALNGRTASFHMADTILEVSKTVKDSSDSPPMKARSPLSTTVFEELTKAVTLVQRSLSESGLASTKNPKKFSPSSLLDRFDGSEPNFRTDSDSELDVKEMSCESPTFSKSSLLQLKRDKNDSKVKNLVSLQEDASSVLNRSQLRKKRKTCSRESSPLPKRSQHERTDIYHIGSEMVKSDLKDYDLDRTCFSKATSSELSFKKKNNVKSPVRSDRVLDLVCAGSHSSSESTVTIADPPRKLLSKSQTNDIEEWLGIANDSSQCDVQVLSSDSPWGNLDKNRDAFSRLSEDSVGEDKLDECTKASVPLDPDPDSDSDSEVEPDSKSGASFGIRSERNPDCLPGSSSSMTPKRPKKKFMFKRLKNMKSPIFRASLSSSSHSASHTSGHDKEPATRSFHLQSSSEDHGQLSMTVESDSEFQQDVWDDFEDNGHIEEFVVLSSPEQHNMSPAEEHIGSERLDCKDSSNSDSPRTLEGSDEHANNDAFNSSFINDFICSSSPMMPQVEDAPHLGDLQQSPYIPLSQRNLDSSSHIAKTPLIAVRRKGRKQPTVPSPFTPMPLFTHMSTPELKNEMKKHGCKQMSRKKMISLLQDIYQKTHQYETDSEFDQSTLHSEATPQMQPGYLENVCLQTRSKTNNEILTPIAVKTVSKNAKSKISKKVTSSADSNIVLAQTSSSDSEVTNLVESALDKPDAVGQYEESFMANEEDILGSQQQTSGSSDNLHDKIREFVLKSPEIYTKMLLYEPVDFDQLKKKISESKIKCAAGKLLGFLDNQCITFAMNKEKQHHGTWKPRVPKK